MNFERSAGRYAAAYQCDCAHLQCGIHPAGCVQSILTQDIAGLEVLLVDDGSTDATPGLCHDLALRDDRIQVITQKNAGICAARNRGLSVAEGVYVTFCDDDDLLLPGALALLLQKAEDTGS